MTEEQHPDTGDATEACYETLKLEYEQICNSHQAITDFRGKLLGLLPLAAGAGIFLLLDKPISAKNQAQVAVFLAAAGVFGVGAAPIQVVVRAGSGMTRALRECPDIWVHTVVLAGCLRRREACARSAGAGRGACWVGGACTGKPPPRFFAAFRPAKKERRWPWTPASHTSESRGKQKQPGMGNTSTFRCFDLAGALQFSCPVCYLASVWLVRASMRMARVSRRVWRAVPRAAGRNFPPPGRSDWATAQERLQGAYTMTSYFPVTVSLVTDVCGNFGRAFCSRGECRSRPGMLRV